MCCGAHIFYPSIIVYCGLRGVGTRGALSNECLLPRSLMVGDGTQHSRHSLSLVSLLFLPPPASLSLDNSSSRFFCFLLLLLLSFTAQKKRPLESTKQGNLSSPRCKNAQSVDNRNNQNSLEDT